MHAGTLCVCVCVFMYYTCVCVSTNAARTVQHSSSSTLLPTPLPMDVCAMHNISTAISIIIIDNRLVLVRLLVQYNAIFI